MIGELKEEKKDLVVISASYQKKAGKVYLKREGEEVYSKDQLLETIPELIKSKSRTEKYILENEEELAKENRKKSRTH